MTYEDKCEICDKICVRVLELTKFRDPWASGKYFVMAAKTPNSKPNSGYYVTTSMARFVRNWVSEMDEKYGGYV